MIGRTISHYRIVEKLGEGGMGVVYKAEDLKLGRAVALKFLSPHLLESEEHKARFLHEARAAALLDHPNICTVHEIDEAGDQTFIAMACLEGHTLKQKIAERPLPLEEALDSAIQIAQGLQIAHEKGIVHRDIKPANIMITPRGQAKIMDFGLAQLSDRTKLTASGMKLGTPAYMCPEQTEGRPTDRRSDLWSLGCVLYEMVSGQPPFSGETEAAVSYAIVHIDPEPLSALRTGVPLELDRIVAKLLAKDPTQRYQHAEDLAPDLRALSKQPTRLRHVPEKRPRPWVWLLAGAAGTSLVWAFAIWTPASRDTTLPTKASIRQITSYTGTERDAAISPDGRYFAFVSTLGGQPDIWVRQVSGGEPVQLTRDTASESDLVYTPDGEFVYYSSTGSIWRIAALGGSPQKIIEQGREPSLSADGRRLAFLRGQDILIAGADGSGETKAGTARGPTAHASLSPDGRRIAFTEGAFLFDMMKLYVVNTDGGRPRWLSDLGFLGDTARPTWLPDSETVVFGWSADPHPVSRASDLWAISAGGGAARRLTANLSGHPRSLHVSADGGRLVATVQNVQFEVWKAPLNLDPESNGKAAERLLGDSYGAMWIHSAGPELLFNSWLTGSRNLWLMRLDQSAPARQITSFAENTVTHAALSPDAHHIAYTSFQTGNAEIWTMNVDGSNAAQLTNTASSEYWPAWTHDGQWITYCSEGERGYPQIWSIPSAGGERVQLTKNGGVRGDWSPVGNRFVYSEARNPNGKRNLEIVDFDGNLLLSVEWPDANRTLPVWSPDGRRFTAIRADSSDNDSVWVFDAATGEGKPAVKFPGRFHLIFRVLWTPDGNSVVADRLERDSNVVLLEDFWP